MNRVELEGGIVGTPDFGFTASERAWARFTLAVSEVQWDGKNQRETIGTTFVSCVAWGYPAEQLMADDPSKGDKLHLQGKLVQSEVEKDGKTERKTRVEISTYQFVSRKIRREVPVPA